MAELGRFRTAILLPHALVWPLVFSALILAILSVVVIKNPPPRAPQRAKAIKRDEDAKRHLRGVEAVRREESAKLGGSLSIDSPPESQTESPVPSSTPILAVKELFDYRLADYKAKLDQLDANLKLQALFIVFAILLVLRRSDSLNLFGNQLPLHWLHLFVPVVMIYLWLSFGFILDGLIHSRLWGIEILRAHSPETADNAKKLFQDSGFIDGWFLSFVDTPQPATWRGPYIGDWSGINHNSRTSTSWMMLFVFGTLLSAAHACMIGIAFIGARRYLRPSFKVFLPTYYFPPFLVFGFLVLSHWQFAYGGSNRNYIQLYIAGVTIFLLAVFLWLSIVKDRTIDPASVECLRNQRRLVSTGGPMSIKSQDSTGACSTMSLIGDSLSTGFYFSSVRSMLPRMWGGWSNTWFASRRDQPKIESVFDRVSRHTIISASVHASSGARVDHDGKRTLLDRLTNARHFSRQVDEVLIGEFPDLLLLWIGHNNIHWRSRFEEPTKESRRTLLREFQCGYKTQLTRLINGALISKKRTVIIVYGLINFESFFGARDLAEGRREADSTKYPYLEKAQDYFTSMKKEHRDEMFRLARLCNKSLQRICGELSKTIRRSEIRLVYSDALSKVKIAEADMLHDSDAWHPSAAGHRMLAESAYEPIKKELIFLGWETGGPTGVPGQFLLLI